ncbi:alpha-N-methyltransferase NTM1 [Mycotypha africana]|uniref:alpha-N-methyltransferase NTM1 n=1 Tax=Mycotypha africana TaxID=64632 RepID=UPI002301BC63|nr:alpha-N-methyltransferase NTM1 [Mycotypha africana]KAI8982336.1 alpha-N-methyltransferase NTM1 [Mycotypha africana]
MQKPEWYTKAQDYWNGVTASVDGMLGGFSVLDPIDVKGSLSFVKEFNHLAGGYACDCGAGIGRVTKNFLLKVPFAKVDVVEQAPSFVEQAKADYLKREIDEGKIGNLYCQGLQDFVPEEGRYDLIWCQWVLGHLTDGLKPNGLIGVKENNASIEQGVFDEEDSSITRPNSELKELFKKAGLTCIKEELQKDFPQGLFPVRMYLLKPSSTSSLS